MAKLKHPLMLIVLDGWGHSEDIRHNAIHAAHTPVFDRLSSSAVKMLVSCSGTDVGLPESQMGNSEVGHMHIGAGRLIDQDFSRITKAANSGELDSNPALASACRQAAATERTLHILGLTSPGGVHSHEDHLVAIAKMAREAGVKQVLLHAFLDGRDTPPKSADASLSRITTAFDALGDTRIATISGRYFAMDRNKNWDRIAPAYAAITDAEAEFEASNPASGLAMAYERGETDEFIRPTVITAKDGSRHSLADGDVVVFGNFRADRARQLTTALTQPDFSEFSRVRLPELGSFVTLTDYGAQFDLPIAFPAPELPNTLGVVLADHGLRQLRIAETEKYAHVTFFLNGGEERTFDGEDRVLIPSPDVATYDLKPEMSAVEVTDALVDALERREYDTIICNFANADMVGHTGNFDATVQCIETLDSCLGRTVEAARGNGIEVLITADHGNAEKMRATDGAEGDGEPHTAHTSNLVPLIYIGRKAETTDGVGTLSDIAPSMLTLMGLDVPVEMTGRPLLIVNDSAQDAA